MARRGIFAADASAMVSKVISLALRPDGAPIEPSGDGYHATAADGRGTVTTKGEVEHNKFRHWLGDVSFNFGTTFRNIVLNIIIWGLIIFGIIYAEQRGFDFKAWFVNAYNVISGFLSSIFS